MTCKKASTPVKEHFIVLCKNCPELIQTTIWNLALNERDFHSFGHLHEVDVFSLVDAKLIRINI